MPISVMSPIEASENAQIVRLPRLLAMIVIIIMPDKARGIYETQLLVER